MTNIGTLREIRESELTMMLDWRNAPQIRANMYTQHEINLDEHLNWWHSVQQKNDQQYFMYEYKDMPSGIVAFIGISNAQQNSSWAFYASPHAPRGTGTRMEFLALEQAFRALHLHKLWCEVLAFNTSVISLHKKFGFQVEGIFRDQYRSKTEFVDIYRLGLLSSEWAVKKPAFARKLSAMTNRQSS